MDVDVKKLLHFESEHIKKLQNIVAQALKDENLIIDNLLHPPKEILTKGQKVSDKVARFGGSWAFILSFFAILFVWIMYNTIAPQ